jgi:DNA adenine methylase
MKVGTSQLSLFPELEIDNSPHKHVVNVASVPQRSPFRYPGGKTWLVPTARKWFSMADDKAELIEVFAGGGIIGLTAAAEHYFSKVTMVELDSDVAAVWQTIFSESDVTWLVDRIKNFELNVDNVKEAISLADAGTKERAFSTIIRNRTNHGGILAKGSGMIKFGEAGKGLSSRWYPETINRRIEDAHKLRNCINFMQMDAFKVLEQRKKDQNAFFFIDPPYTVAGRRLYNLFNVDHRKIFEIASQIKGHFLLTYDDAEEVRNWADEFGLFYRTIPMQTTHLIKKNELLISDNFDWLEDASLRYEYRSAVFG